MASYASRGNLRGLLRDDRKGQILSARAERLRRRIVALYLQAEAAGEKDMAAKLLRMDEASARNATSAAMRELLPDVQALAKYDMPPVSGFLLLFLYRLEMLSCGIYDTIGV